MPKLLQAGLSTAKNLPTFLVDGLSEKTIGI
jgi:hypothetical protein